MIYFLGASPGRSQPIIPNIHRGMAPGALTGPACLRSVGRGFGSGCTPSLSRGSLRAPGGQGTVVHQASFRDAVLTGYGGRCAISLLPEPRLLDAAHIVMDADEQLGQPIVSNGLPLTKLHHAAFDAHLIGIDRISESLSPTGCSKSMVVRFLNSGRRESPGRCIRQKLEIAIF